MRALVAGGLTALSLVATSSVAAAHDGETGDPFHGSVMTQGHTSKLEDLRDVTAPYRSGPRAPWTTQVFDLSGITCIEDPAGRGTMGIHFVDVANLLDGEVDRLSPEALIYEPGPDGSLTLIAVEYLIFAEAWDAEHASVPILYGQRFARVAAGNRYGLPAFYELHVWHEKANPNGTFNDWNPDVRCG